MTVNSANAKTIEKELEWFQELIMLRGRITFEQSVPEEEFRNMKLPDISNQDSAYANLIKKHSMGMEERLILILALIPHVKPSLLDLLHMKNALYDIPLTEFGGIRNDKHKGYLPTGETAIFLLAGTNLEKRFELIRLFGKDHFFHREGILSLERSDAGDPLLYGLLSISQEFLSLFTTGNYYKPDFSPNFPAKRIYTNQDWDDLVVSDDLLHGLEEIKDYILHGKNPKIITSLGKK